MVSAIVTPALLASLRCVPHLPHHTWFFLTSATLSSLNLPSEIPHVLRFALENGGGRLDSRPEREEQLQICRKTREALIKLVPISGLPKVLPLSFLLSFPSLDSLLQAINALNALKSATPSNLLDDPLGYSPTGRTTEVYDIPSSAILNRGHSFWSIVYGKISRRVMGNLDRSGTEDLGLMARLMYGYILSNTSVLSAKDTSYVLLAGLIPQDVGYSSSSPEMILANEE